MNKILKLFFVFLLFHSSVFSTEYWQPYPIHAEVITYNGVDRKVKFSVYDSLSGIWRYYNTPYYTCPAIELTDTMNTIIGFKILDYNQQSNLEITGYYGFIIFDQETHQFKPIFDQVNIPYNNYLSMSMKIDDASMTFDFEDDNGFKYAEKYTMLYSIIKNKWDTIIDVVGYYDFDCLEAVYLGGGFGYTCEHYSSSDDHIYVRYLIPDLQLIGGHWDLRVGTFVTRGWDMTIFRHNGVYDFDSYLFAIDPTPTYRGYMANVIGNQFSLKYGILQTGERTIIYDDSLHQLKVDSTNIAGINNVIIKDGVVACRSGNFVWCKAFSPTTRNWVVSSFPSTGIDSLKIENGTVKWVDNISGASYKAGYIDSIGWGNYDTPLLLSFHATERYTSSGLPYVFVRNYSIGTDSICYDFGDGVISDYKQHSLYHLYKVNGHYQSTYPNVNYNICIKTVNDSGPQSSCLSYAITCVDPTVPVITASTDTTCSNQAVVLSIAGNLNSAQKWTWYLAGCGNAAPLATGDTITVNPLVTKTYYARAEGGCAPSSDCDTLTVIVNPAPQAVATASGPTTFCLGDSVTLNANIGVGLNYQWVHYGNIIPGAINPSYTSYTPGPYFVEVANSNCTDSSAVINVNVPCLPPSDPISKINSETPTEIETWYADNLVFINAKGIRGDSWSMKIYNLVGKLVYSKSGKVTKQSNGLGTFNHQNELTVAEGIYFLSIKTEDEQIVKKIIVR